ncbi:hypothetical protein [Pyxidicoccus xibeiensis]|uniref:hypothetical protein n=1 Tax=Pyxidicoccus xibeiensis TaxID=2906759 RepID=UPI0020A80A3A|nr:hypothetical protein [Pyxidicoccus xibeiensis]MCP3140302.1 hypothetical protein [Pyxidicoccus xibeiensis]
MRNILAVAGTAAVLGLSVVGTDARAADILYDGNFCAPVLADVDRVNHSPQYGVYTASISHNTTVQCPFNPPFFATVSEVYVQVYDRNPFVDITCTLRGIDLAGVIIWSQTDTSSYSGPGVQFLGFYPYARTHTMTMTCTIPYVWNAGFSHVLTYRAIHTP